MCWQFLPKNHFLISDVIDMMMIKMWCDLFLVTTINCRDDSLQIDAIVSATQEKSWKIYKSHILMAIPSMPRVLGIRKYKQTSENADGYVLQWFLTLHWGKIISSDQNIVWTKKKTRGVNVSFSITPSLVFHGLFCQTKT